jgi:putative phosphoribosyl transferase
LFDTLKNKFQLRFKNREFAAKILAGALEDSLKKLKLDKKKDSLLILGIPRGGVVIADIVMTKLPYNCEFDIFIPRKLTAPHNQEIAIGAIISSDDSNDIVTYLNDELIRDLGIGNEYLEKEKLRQLDEIKRRKTLYRNSKDKSLDITEKNVILVDDGAATGATLIVAARWLRRQNPCKLIIAIPVTSKDTSELLNKECDMVVTGTTPSASVFKTVGQYYQEFKPIEDEQVVEICKQRNTSST